MRYVNSPQKFIVIRLILKITVIIDFINVLLLLTRVIDETITITFFHVYIYKLRHVNSLNIKRVNLLSKFV